MGGEAFPWHGVKRDDAFAFYAGDIRVEVRTRRGISYDCSSPYRNHRVKTWVRSVATQTPVAPANQSARRNDES